MTDRTYTRAVEKELIRVARLAGERETEAKLKEIGEAISRWKKKRTSAELALEDARRVALAVPTPWSDEADPGVPVAQAVTDGLILRKDLSPAAWKAIEVLIAVAEV